MKNSGWQAAWQHWLSFSAFTLAGVAFEGARFGSVVSPETTVAEPAKWRKADAVSPQGHAGAQR
ncbi:MULTISPECIES: hypothetical protein [Pantoea]|jgi:hypothetical protein|uniref:Uncharacterized protein n=1 Tax=Pantoea anthophila TaxID=470931 RepID=A0ABY2ZEH1_9GAMM|nr:MULTISPECIES: hypothetical protein [Pantoea]KAF6661148.1 hypothetical protein HFD91_07095 [Enterobacteriaceae bacterium EKM102V]TPE16022.1 hypothetical protein FJP62_11555 [Pantoea vagans]EIB98158.1 hypothetical protein S7A_06570 [Pantoea sp. Sc1]KAA5974980.1 hypothetical protein F3I51_03585 [Pantoea sp. M_6]KAA5979334.1 hypothetical protein F3I52_05140 [Pantoea sp. M_8]